ncbi:DUF1631 family protein [Piscinibacter koreensis]|uniref:DUF1631 family protein n=1 Tax=Piscinibacter koreensis TaxID=2742824 RepID=A0A7Y6NLF9_9BURK|nr:DUF1631 family protein [Schlegelella koreensis]NUZ05257.1 DUF1631 family protein [Schlegelella koreensis]
MAALNAAQELIRAAASTAVVEAANHLLALMRTAPTYHQRGQLAFAQVHLMQRQTGFVASFAKALRQRVAEDIDSKDAAGERAKTDWDAIGLVEGDAIEEKISFDRIAQFISHACETELLELARYTSALLRHGAADPERNPLRAQVIGAALHEAIETISEDVEIQKVVGRELGQIFAKALPACYRQIIDDLKARDVRPADLAVVPTKAATGAIDGPGEMQRFWERSLQGRPLPNYGIPDLPGLPAGTLGVAEPGDALRGWQSSLMGRIGGSDAMLPEGLDSAGAAAFLDRLMRGAPAGQPLRSTPPAPNTPLAQADAEMMALLKRIGSAHATTRDNLDGVDSHGGLFPPSRYGETTASGLGAFDAARSVRGALEGVGELMAVNLIRAHRDELIEASRGKLDHMVIDVVSSLFDQILSDPRVPSPMARQIARLQLPVLRVALRDPNFFASRRHPVRRFINRVSSLAAAYDEFRSGPGKELLVRVSQLVKEIVEGDFDQLEIYSEKLLALEKFVAEQTAAEVEATPAGPTLEAKEREWRLIQRFTLQLRGALDPLALPGFVKEFLSQVWGQVIMTAAERQGGESALVRQLRRAGYDLVASIQPKRSAEQRRQFLATLPKLMTTLKDGVALIEWPEPARGTFFSSLVAAHAGSLKLPPGSELDHNMLMKHVETAFRTPIPRPEDLDRDADEPALPVAAVEPQFSPEEARNVGLLAETAVDWSAPVDGRPPVWPGEALDINLDLPDPVAPAPTAADADVDVDDAAGADAEPSEGPQLRDHLHIGQSYQLHLKDQWEKVRLTYMSPGRNLFLFTHGSKDRRTISMTVRMLERLCQAHRMRSYEGAPLIDRATARARQQLAEQDNAARPAAGGA